MEKDFDGWNRKKRETHGEEPRLYTVREILWCRLGVNVGTEQDGGGNGTSVRVSSCEDSDPTRASLPRLPHPPASIRFVCRSAWLMAAWHERTCRSCVSLIRGGWNERLAFWKRRPLRRYEKPPENCSDGFSHILPLAGARPRPTVRSSIHSTFLNANERHPQTRALGSRLQQSFMKCSACYTSLEPSDCCHRQGAVAAFINSVVACEAG